MSLNTWPVFGIFSSIVAVCAAFPAVAEPMTSGPDVAAYRKVIDAVFSEFAPELTLHDAQPEIVFHEKSSGVGAFTWRKNGGRVWEFHFYDGVLKLKNIGSDVLSMIVCHELGHQLAGYPFNENTNWSAAEGQADYFSSHACAPRIWEGDTELNASFATRIPAVLKARCDESFPMQLRRDICYRGVFTTDLMRHYEGLNQKKLPSLFKPDATVVATTNTRHPAPQCRIDTQLAGVFCSREFDFSKIPGHLGSAKNSPEAEHDAADSHCESEEFPSFMKRPRCWFAPFTSLE